jgi:hypothetical protein
MKISYTDYQILGTAIQKFTDDLPYGALTIIVHKRAPITCELHLRIDEYFEATEIRPLAEDLLALSQLAQAVNQSNCMINWGQSSSEFEGLDEDEVYTKFDEKVAELVNILQGAFDGGVARPFSNWLRSRNVQ